MKLRHKLLPDNIFAVFCFIIQPKIIGRTLEHLNFWEEPARNYAQDFILSYTNLYQRSKKASITFQRSLLPQIALLMLLWLFS